MRDALKKILTSIDRTSESSGWLRDLFASEYENYDPSDALVDGLPFIWGAFALKLVAGVGLLAIGLAQWIYPRRPIAASTPSGGDGRLPPSPGREG